MTYLTREMTKEIKDWKFKGYLSEGYKLVVKTYESDVNYISIELLDEDEDIEKYIDLPKEYKEEDIENMKKDSKKVRSEIARKLDMKVKEIKIIDVIN